MYPRGDRPTCRPKATLKEVTLEIDVAEAVFQAATDESAQLQYQAGADALALA